jgi:ankyrin repeat protein
MHHLAARKGDNNLVKFLIETGTKVDAQSVSILTARVLLMHHLATRKGDNDLVKFLIERGLKVDAQNVSVNSANFTVHHLAARKGEPKWRIII